MKQIRKWRAEGDRIVLFMDHNEHVYDGALGKALSDSEGLNLQEVIFQHTGTKLGQRSSEDQNQLMVFGHQAT